MEVINEKDRKKLILESQKYGGISLRRQKLRVHKNGAKFPISKAYVDDELLDPEISYTLILIPEVKIADQTIVSLTFFKRRSGPLIYYYYPENSLKVTEKVSIVDTMISASNEKYFIHQSSNLSSLNYYFEIHSEWARGKKEMVMISIILNTKITKSIEDITLSICIDFETDLTSIKDIYKALYDKDLGSFSDEEQSDIEKISRILRTKIKELHKKIRILDSQKFTKVIFKGSMKIEKKLDLTQIAQGIQDAEFNPEKFPGLIMKIEKPNATILMFSDGKLMITNLENPSKVDLVVDIIVEKLKSIAIIIPKPEITIESTK